MTRTVLITGTSSGLGDATARQFLAAGWKVVATARLAERAVPGSAHPELLRLRLDVTDQSSIEDAFRDAEARFGEISAVVNNAGIGLGGPLEGVDLGQLRDHFETNVVGVAAVCQVALRGMRKRRRGVIVNVSSAAGRVGLPFMSPYCAGKFAVEGLSEALQYEVKPFGIRVKLVEPGGMRSSFAHAWAKVEAYERTTSSVRAAMEKGALSAALPEVAARTIIRAVNDTSDRLRYPATDAGMLFALRRVLPDSLWRALVGKIFGLSDR